MPNLVTCLEGYVCLSDVYLGVDLRNTPKRHVVEKRMDYVFNICKLFQVQ